MAGILSLLRTAEPQLLTSGPEARTSASKSTLARMRLLGPMRAEAFEDVSILPQSRKARALLAYLCLAEGRPVPRARLAGQIWERVTDAQARVSLRQALLDIGRAMGSLRSELLDLDRDTIRLRTDRCWIDALAFRHEPACALEAEAADFQPERLLEGFEGISASFDQWLFAERARFAEALRKDLEAGLNRATASGAEAADQAAAARRLIAFDPTHEGACRALMRVLAARGERAQAVKEFARCRAALRLTLETEPAGETRALYEAIRLSSIQSDPPFLLRPSISPSRPSQALRTEDLPGSWLRIVVMPFITAGPGVEDALAFGLSQDVASALARFGRFDVIAPDAIEPQIRAFDLVRQDRGLDYAVDGALTAVNGRLRIGIRLLHMSGYARPVWSEKFETPLDDIDRLDEVVTARVAARIDPVILFREASARPGEPLDAMGLTVRASPLLYSMERSTFAEAGRLLEEAIRREPDNVMATAWAAYWRVFEIGQGWTRNVTDSIQQAQALSLRAIRLGPDNAEAAAIHGHACSFLNKDFDAALHFFGRAQRLNPSLGLVWALSAATHCYIGEPEIALARLDHYRDLAPFDPYFSFFESIYTNAHMFRGDDEQAARVRRRVVRANPDFANGYKPLIASLGRLGRIEEAIRYRSLLASRQGHSVLVCLRTASAS